LTKITNKRKILSDNKCLPTYGEKLKRGKHSDWNGLEIVLGYFCLNDRGRQINSPPVGKTGYEGLDRTKREESAGKTHGKQKGLFLIE